MKIGRSALHGSSVEHRPEGTPDAERGAGDNGEGDVIGRTDAASHTDEDGGD